MRPTRMIVALVGGWLIGSGPLWAGLYNTEEPPEGPEPDKDGAGRALPLSLLRTTISDVIQLGIDPPPPAAFALVASLVGQYGHPEEAGPWSASAVAGTSRYLRYRIRRNQLRAKEQAGTATVEDRVNLGAYLIRLGEPVEAIVVLREAATQDRRNFRALANLATAYQLSGEWTAAIGALRDALDNWPEETAGLSRQQLAWYKAAEKYHMELLRLRAREAVRNPRGQMQSITEVDDLFKVRFVGNSGEYEAGQLAEAERAKLRAEVQAKVQRDVDPLAVVQQLLIWLPQDGRLYWLLGELLNAKGDIKNANEVFYECVNSRHLNAPDLLEHRRIVREAVDAANVPPPATSWMPEMHKLLIVGGAAGVLIVGLIALQVREVRRRRQEASASKNG